MNEIKEKIEAISKWIEENKEFVETIKKDNTWTNQTYRNIIFWYEDNKDNVFILGDKMVTIEDIRKEGLNIGNESDYENGYYDEDGHCGIELYHEIIEFWNDFKTDDDVMYVAIGKWSSDELDLVGGRDYLLTGLSPLLFNYIYYTLKYSQEEFENSIYNSHDINDEISDHFPPDISMITNIKKAEKKKIIKDIIIKETRKVDEFLLKYPNKMEEDLEQFKHLKFVGYSKIDNRPIYQLEMQLPTGFEVIEPKIEIKNKI